MAPPIYYYFAGSAVAAVFFLVINAVAILCSSPVKQITAAVKMRREKLRWMPATAYKAVEGKGEEECSVCLSVLAEGERVRQMPHCLHSFHVLCIDKWLVWHCSCPICRGDVLQTESTKTEFDNLDSVL